MLNSAAIAGPVIALAAHAALVIAVAAAALKRIP